MAYTSQSYGSAGDRIPCSLFPGGQPNVLAHIPQAAVLITYWSQDPPSFSDFFNHPNRNCTNRKSAKLGRGSGRFFHSLKEPTNKERNILLEGPKDTIFTSFRRPVPPISIFADILSSTRHTPRWPYLICLCCLRWHKLAFPLTFMTTPGNHIFVSHLFH